MELVDNNRPHFKPPSNTNNNELFICFTSRLSSSSSMKIAKSILSPGRAARDPPVSLSTSLSRRLRSNGSVKSGGMASPMFPKKKGPGFENPEPSSPKVTCIGQVRVKTKKKVKQQTRSLSRRRSGVGGAGEVSFRKVGEIQPGEKLGSPPAGVAHNNPSLQTQIQHQECMNGRNQKWVHFPGTICEALSCLLPCRSSCFSREKGKEEASEIYNNGGGSTSSSCAAVFTRWFVSVHDCEGGKGREIELVVGGGDEEEEDGKTEIRQRISMRSSRRHVFEDMEFNEEMMADVKDEEEVEKARVSICVPPKNALLLMRCRSDPMKMADLTNRFWESPAPPEDEDEEHDESAVQVAEVSENVAAEEMDKDEAENNNGEEKEEMDKEVSFSESVAEMEEIVAQEEEVEEKADEDEEMQESEEAESNIDAFEDLLGEETAESSIQWQIEQEEVVEQAVQEEEETSPELLYSTSFLYRDCETWEMLQEDDEHEEEDTEKLAMEDEEEEEETVETASFEEDPTEAVAEEKEEATAAADETGFEEVEEKRTSTSSNVLPDCLLMMMCEPKLSMEVSKETWVCSTDFVRWLPERPPRKKVHAPPEEAVVPKKAANLHPLPPLPAAPPPRQQKLLPGRSSCTLPAAAAVSMAAMIEQKLVNAVGYEPFVLTRCKSEPMRTAAAKLLPEACCWKNRKLEPHRNATFGVGAAGLGF